MPRKCITLPVSRIALDDMRRLLHHAGGMATLMTASEIDPELVCSAMMTSMRANMFGEPNDMHPMLIGILRSAGRKDIDEFFRCWAEEVIRVLAYVKRTLPVAFRIGLVAASVHPHESGVRNVRLQELASAKRCLFSQEDILDRNLNETLVAMERSSPILEDHWRSFWEHIIASGKLDDVYFTGDWQKIPICVFIRGCAERYGVNTLDWETPLNTCP